MTTMKYHDWHGLYRESWGAEIVPDAYSHPAKYGRGLIRAIYQHLLGRGYIAPGDRIVDPFGGVALGAIDAMRYGLHWHGVELEPRFVALAEKNIELWNARYRPHFPAWGTAQIHQGDSRQLAAVLQAAGAVVSSPPYATNGMHDNPSSRDSEYFGGRTLSHGLSGYGTTPGQLGAMPEGQPPTAVVSSPPYADAIDGTGEGPGARFDAVHHAPDNARKQSSANGYGTTPGNLGAMPAGAVVGSPPFEGSLAGDNPDKRGGVYNTPERSNGGALGLGASMKNNYGTCPGNIGNDSGATFWQAARAIVEQCYQVLRPGGVAIWVTGDYVRGGQRVAFGQQWLDLCCAVGFTPVEWIRAWKVEPGPVQLGLLGDDRDMTIERVSFFRRLANQRNPAAAILNEDVIIVRR